MYRRNFLEKLFQFTLSQCQRSYGAACSRSSAENPPRSRAAISSANHGDSLRRAIVVSIRSKSTSSKLDRSKVPKLDENDLVEQFVRGSGPGGQATAKTNNAVVLKHLPSGIVVKCHETRSLWENKKRAREILITKLDNMINGEDSLESQERALNAKKSANKTRKREKMLALKAAFKEREGIE